MKELPPGFVLDEPTGELPQGFVLDTPEQVVETPEQVVVRPTNQLRKKSILDEILRRAKGAGEVAATMGSSMIAEPLAGYEGIEKGLVEGVKTGSMDAAAKAASEAVAETRKDLTYVPKSEEGKEYMEGIGGALEPVGELFQSMEQGLGDKAFEITGSPALAALATTFPTAVLEATPFVAGPAVTASFRKFKNLKQTGKITKALKEAVPETDQLFKTAGDMFNEIDELGAVVKASEFDKLISKADSATKKSGRHRKVTPGAEASIKELNLLKGEDIKISDIEVQRKIAQNVAKSRDPADAARGLEIVDAIDDFINNLDEGDFISVKGNVDIGARYDVARKLWGKARRSEMINDAFERANLKEGFEKNIKSEFNKILQSDKKRKFFSKHEIDAMTVITKPGAKQNLYDFASRFELSSKNIWTPLMGMSSVGYLGGPAAAASVPIIGAVSKGLAERLILKNATFANQVIRSGKNARKITKAYLDNTAPAARSAEELSQLLMRENIDLNKLPKNALANEAKKITLDRRTELAGVLAAPEVKVDEKGKPTITIRKKFNDRQ